MKYWTLIIGLMITYSCRTNDDDTVDSKLTNDTILITEKLFYYGDDSSVIFNYTIIRKQQGDSLLIFQYYKDTVLSRQYDFNIRQGQFKLIQDKGNPGLAVVDTFSIQLLNENLVVYKYELQLPAIDGDWGILFNKKYGRLGCSAYTWGNRSILTNWNNLDFEEELKAILLADTVRYLKRQEINHPPPPGLPGIIRIVEDEEEIEEEKLEEK